MAVHGLIALLFGILGWWHGIALNARGVRVREKVSLRRIPTVGVTGSGFVAVNASYFLLRDYTPLLWYLPAVIDYYSYLGLRLFNAAVCGFLFATAGSLVYRGGLRMVGLLILLGVPLLPLVDAVYQRGAWNAIPDATHSYIDSDGVVRQTSGATCAAAACANIARIYHVELTEADMVLALGTTESGTSPAQIVVGMRRLGFPSRKRISAERDIAAVTPPAVLFVRYGNEPLGHAVAFVRRDGDNVTILDPKSGKADITLEQLQTEWAGYAVEISAPDAIP